MVLDEGEVITKVSVWVEDVVEFQCPNGFDFDTTDQEVLRVITMIRIEKTGGQFIEVGWYENLYFHHRKRCRFLFSMFISLLDPYVYFFILAFD